MTEYKTKNVVKLLLRRETGSPLKGKGNSVRHKRNNYRCDFELLRSLLCDNQSHLEVLACRRVSSALEPSFCHNRLFTNNYHTWFDLCTSPTSGPRLMVSNVFSDEIREDVRSPNCIRHGIKVIDAVTLNPPNGLSPMPNNEHLSCILLLTRSGWLYQFCLDNSALINKIFIPTNVTADKLRVAGEEGHRGQPSNGSSYNVPNMQIVEKLRFHYMHANLIGLEDKVLLRSATLTHRSKYYVAFVILALFPLRLVDHFVTVSSLSTVKTEIWNDILVLSAVKKYSLSLYSFQDIKKMHQIESSHSRLHVLLQREDLLGKPYLTAVGKEDVGFPYTMRPIDLDKYKTWENSKLFQTKAERHIFRVGGIPYHYIVPINKTCSLWSLRNLADSKEVSKFQLEEKWDNSHLSGFDFHSDESGRIVLTNRGKITVYSLEQIAQSANKPNKESICSTFCNNLHHKIKGKTTKNSQPHHICSAKEKSKLLTTYPISDTNNQLRVMGANSASQSSPTRKCKVRKCFEINTADASNMKNNLSSDEDESVSEGAPPDWKYPSSLEGHRSSSGRLLRKPQHFGINGSFDQDPKDIGVLGVSYEDELDLLAVLHYRLAELSSLGTVYDLVVSLYDNFDGAKLNTLVIESDVIPTDESGTSLILDEDTIIFTKRESNHILDYRIMRFCRRC